MSAGEDTLASLKLPTYVNTRKEDVIELLYKPCLQRATRYVRGVGYFRSSVFRLMTEDLLDFCIKGGHITLLTSTQWGKEDYEVTMQAYKDYETTGLKEDLTALLEDPETVEPTRMLCALIQNGKLDFRVAVLRGDIYHQKKGYFEDDHGNIVAFDGSGNETLSALKPFDEGNAESFNLAWNWDPLLWNFYGGLWKHDLDQSLDPNQDSTFPVVRIQNLDPEFIDTWDIDISLESHRESARKRQRRIRSKWDEVYGQEKNSGSGQKGPENGALEKPCGIIENEDLHRDHQTKSLAKWRENGRRGVLEHATGSGKTITSLIAINEHVKEGNHAIILVPSEPLLDQWDEEMDEHLPHVTRGLLGAGKKDSDILSEMRISVEEGNSGVVLVSTMQSFRNKSILRNVDRLLASQNSPLMLVVDECHRIGAPSYGGICSRKFPMTLGLSATPERQRDEEGTSRLFGLLGKVVDQFSLEDALEAKLLSPFEYHVKEAKLTDGEQHKYDDLKVQIRKKYAQWVNSGTEIPESLEILIFMSRAIIRNAENKVPVAVEIIRTNFSEGEHWLVYCGEGMMDDVDYLITKHTGRKPLRYWSGMNRFQRKQSLKDFKNNGGIMLAIKCLDEGVDIPAISHGIVLSSSKTTREWIQRRGRLLRKSKMKEKSVIFDVLAYPSDHGTESTFVLDELKRALEFSKSSINRIKVVADIERKMREYNISEDDVVIEPEEDLEEDDNG